MISLELLYAVLQGLPAQHLQHLEPLWVLFCSHIQKALENGRPPAAALRHALQLASPSHLKGIRETLTQGVQVRRLTRLSYRQQQLLTALRVVKVATLTQLCGLVLQERPHAFRRLAALIAKGHVIKFYKPGGVYYMPVGAPLSRQDRSQVNQVLLELIKELEQSDRQQVQSFKCTAPCGRELEKGRGVLKLCCSEREQRALA